MTDGVPGEVTKASIEARSQETGPSRAQTAAAVTAPMELGGGVGHTQRSRDKGARVDLRQH